MLKRGKIMVLQPEALADVAKMDHEPELP